MKRIFSVFIAMLAAQAFVFAQCPNASITTPGFHPPADQLTPIERGVAYNEDLQVNIPASFDTVLFGNTVTVTIDSIQVNSITGQPSGITYTCSPSANCKLNGGSAGCVNFSGTTNDAAGQYPLTVNITAYVTVPLLGQQTQTLNMSDLGFTYYLTVVEAGALSVSVSAAPASICAGGNATLNATVTNGSGSETFAWSNGLTGSSITIQPTATTTYTVTVTDGGNTVTGSATITVNNPPVAGFTSSALAMPTVTFENTSTGATSNAWNFGDGSTGTDPNPTHTYQNNGTFTVTQIVTNSCGSDTASEDVTITGVFIGTVSNDLQFSVYPNPSEGIFTVTLANSTGVASTISVYDFSGKRVYEETISGIAEKKLDLSALPKGVYTLHLNSEKSNGVQKLVIR